MGTCKRGPEEVLAYDYDAILTHFTKEGWSEDEVGTWLGRVCAVMPDGQEPLFIYTDSAIRFELETIRHGQTVH